MVKHLLALLFALLAAPAFAQVDTGSGGPGPLPPLHSAIGVASGTPAPISGTTLKMLGLGSAVTFTPTTSGNVQVACLVNATFLSSTAAGDGMKVQLMWGTGGAPSNGAAVTGTVLIAGLKSTYPTAATAIGTVSTTQISVIIAPADIGVPIWVDLAEDDLTANHEVSALATTCSWDEAP